MWTGMQVRRQVGRETGRRLGGGGFIIRQTGRKADKHLPVCACVCVHVSYDLSPPTFEYGTYLPDPCCPLSVVLPQGQLHVEERHARYHHEEQVRHQECACKDTQMGEA